MYLYIYIHNGCSWQSRNYHLIHLIIYSKSCAFRPLNSLIIYSKSCAFRVSSANTPKNTKNIEKTKKNKKNKKNKKPLF